MHYVPYFVFLPILGLCFSSIAFFVIRREYMFYNESDAKLRYVEKVLGLTSRAEFLDQRLRKATRAVRREPQLRLPVWLMTWLSPRRFRSVAG